MTIPVSQQTGQPHTPPLSLTAEEREHVKEMFEEGGFEACACDPCTRFTVAYLAHEMRQRWPTAADMKAELAEWKRQTDDGLAKYLRKPLKPGVQRKVWDRDHWRCKCCGDHRGLTVDHIQPVAKGGTNDLENLQTLCGRCNSVKHDHVMTIEELKAAVFA